MELIEINESEFDNIYTQMQNNFILEERRDYIDAKAVLKNEEYKIFHVRENGRNIGFISIWNLHDFAFIEHFVIYGEYRNLGYGSIALDKVKQAFKNLVLEAELPKVEIAKRRIGFYIRNGFVNNEKEYYQPSYRKGGEGVYLTLMSYPNKISDFEKTKQKIYKRVYNK